VAHPANLLFGLTIKDFAARGYGQLGCAVLALAGGVNASTQGVGQSLKAVADA